MIQEGEKLNIAYIEKDRVEIQKQQLELIALD